MDKLRALQYFVAAADARSFSGAARSLDVSVPAIAKLINALERDLGASLFERNAQGLTLTADGDGYLDACRPLIEQLAAADEALSGASIRPRGMVVVGVPPQLAQHCILPALPRFHARYPEVQIDIRMVNRISDVEPSAIDIFVVLGWPEHAELVHRRIGQMQYVVCAAPAYWTSRGMVQRPKDLERHVCLLFRDPKGTVLDLWSYERGGVTESAAVTGWLVSNHRDVILDAVLAGEGVARFTDLTLPKDYAGSRLVPALLDWRSLDAPPVNLLYRANHRRNARVRVFADFVTALFRDLEIERRGSVGPRTEPERPDWHKHHHSRASAAVRGER